MKCSNCGQENPDGMKFCSLCGSLMPSAPVQPNVTTPTNSNSDSAEGIPVSLVDDTCLVWVTDDENFEEFGEWLEDEYKCTEGAEVSYDESDASLSFNGGAWGFCPYDWVVFIANEPKIYNQEEFDINWNISGGYDGPGLYNCSFLGTPVLYKLTEKNIKAVAEKLSSTFNYTTTTYSSDDNSISLDYGANSSSVVAGEYLVVFGEDFRIYSSEANFSKMWKID